MFSYHWCACVARAFLHTPRHSLSLFFCLCPDRSLYVCICVMKECLYIGHGNAGAAVASAALLATLEQHGNDRESSTENLEWTGKKADEQNDSYPFTRTCELTTVQCVGDDYDYFMYLPIRSFSHEILEVAEYAVNMCTFVSRIV